MAWKSVVAAANAALLLLLAAPSHARFDLGNVGIPTSPGALDPGDLPPIGPPPPPPPLALQGIGLNWIELVVRAPAGRASTLLRQPPGGSFTAFQTPAPGSETVVRDTDLRLGQSYCYRLDVTGGSLPDESHTRCGTTDWRVGFEGLRITQAESAEVLDLFDWRDTQALPEGTPDAPALYYMNLLVEGGDPDAEQGYRSLGMHVQPSPLFPEELDGWSDSDSIAKDCGLSPVLSGDLQVQARALAPLRDQTVFGSCVPIGRWYFTAVPGRIYNEIRTRMIDQIGRGEAAGIRALVFRHIPVAAALAPGVSRHVLNYTYLGQQGFEFNAIPRCWSNGDGTSTCQQYLLGWVLRKVVGWVVELGDEVIEGVRSAVGRIERLVKGEVELDLQFRLLNTDPAFGTNEVMRSGWSGEELKLGGVQVVVRQGFAGFYGHTDANGHVKLTVAKNSDTKVCLEVENDTAEFTEFLIETTVCVKSLGELDGDRSEVVDVRHDYVNALAAMTDARQYMKSVAGHDMPKITVLVGGNAMLLTPNGRSFTPCAGRVPSIAGLGLDLVTFWSPIALTWSATAEFLLSVDIVLNPGDDGSRGVPVHEYGHAVMCDYLLDQGIDAFELVWTDVAKQAASQGADDEASYLAEGFADFVAAQVVGGTNYFAGSGSSASEHVNYCAAGTPCLENNGTDRSSFKGQVERVVTTLLDAFDGPDGVATANDGSHWQVSSQPFVFQGGTNDSNRNDEGVVLDVKDLGALFEHWDERGTLLREDNFLGGLADLAEERGYAEADVCAMFALHDSSATCPSYIARRPWLDWHDAATGGLLAAFAAAPAPAPHPSPSGEPVAAPAGGNGSPPALLLAIASGAPAPGTDASPESAPAPGSGPADPCADCSRVVVLDGVQKLAVPGLGKSERDTAFAFRLGAGAFEGIDPLGQLYVGAWDARDPRGAKLRLHVGPDAQPDLERLLAASAGELGLGADALRVTGPAKIELRLSKGGSLVGKIVVRFEVEADGRTRRGTYVAKLLGAEA